MGGPRTVRHLPAGPACTCIRRGTALVPGPACRTPGDYRRTQCDHGSVAERAMGRDQAQGEANWRSVRPRSVGSAGGVRVTSLVKPELPGRVTTKAMNPAPTRLAEIL